MTVYVNDISVVGPGLVDRETSMAILRGEENWKYEELPKFKPDMLPANERRRTTAVINLALQGIQQLLREHDDLQSVATVFASSEGDLNIVDKMCIALAQEEKIISPTVFHNSVHNAVAGYWSIAASMKGPSTSLSAGDATFVCGLQEAVSHVEVEGGTVLYSTYDYPAPPMLDTQRHFGYPLAIGLRLGSEPEFKVLGSLTLKGRIQDSKESHCRNSSLESLRTAVPTGCGLPLIEALVRRARMNVVLPYHQGDNYQIIISH